MKPLGASICAVALLAAAPAAAQQRMPGLAPSPDSAEAGLWTASERAEQQARTSARLNPDPALNAYVRDLACEAAPEYCEELRVYVMDQPAFNAMAAPNGYLEIWSGLLLRADSAAEVAFVLGHEVGHYAENHSIEQWNTTKGWMTAALVVTGAAAGAGAYYQVDLRGLGDLAYLTAMSSVYGFSRLQEGQSDQIGFQRAIAAGYHPDAPAALWRNLQEETAASSFRNVRRAEARNSIFRTHPVTAERIGALEALAAQHPDGGRLDRERHRAAIRPHLSAWLGMELDRRDFDGLLVLIDRLARDGEDLGVLEFHRGEIFRLRREDGDLRRARDAYAAAALHPDAPAAAWRQLGELSARMDDPEGAARAWRTYLEIAVGADDRWIVEDSLNALEGASE
ncbi:MAG: M48 family metallopeptidase [Brevundimonas sp.]